MVPQDFDNLLWRLVFPVGTKIIVHVFQKVFNTEFAINFENTDQ